MLDNLFAPSIYTPPIPVSVLEIKALVRARDDYRCTECGMTAEKHVKNYGRNLDVHRLEPGSKYTVEGCVTLCRPCHGDKPRRPKGAVDKERSYITITITIPLSMYEALQKIAKEERRSVSAQACIAIEQYLAEQGFWPPSN